VRGDAGLAHAKDFLKLGHGEFLLPQEEEKTQAGIIGEEAERFED
jgi:hypothetical protein